MSGSLNVPPRPTSHSGSNVSDRPSTPVSHSPMSHTTPPVGSSPPTNCFLRIARPLMTTPRKKSKLSIILSDSSDSDSCDNKSIRSSSPSCGPSGDELDPSARIHQSRKPSVSRLSFPFVKSAKSPPQCRVAKPVAGHTSTPSPSAHLQPASLPAPPTREDVNVKLQNALPQPPTVSPSLFSHPPDSNTQRYSYCHRGYSRQALTHTKWFWAMQEEKWEGDSRPVRKNGPPPLDTSFLEDPLNDPPALPLSSIALTRHAHLPQSMLPPMSVHPRRGDLSTLRDPYCTQIDRSFVVLPIWTIGKTLWMYDVHLVTQNHGSRDVEAHDLSDAYETESESECPDTAASSVIFSDDSDATLVDSETESDLSPGGSNAHHQLTWDQGFNEKRPNLSRETFFSSSSPHHHQNRDTICIPPTINPDFTYPYGTRWSQSAYSEPPVLARTHRGQKVPIRRTTWPNDWYRRWACMIEVARREQLNQSTVLY